MAMTKIKWALTLVLGLSLAGVLAYQTVAAPLTQDPGPAQVQKLTPAAATPVNQAEQPSTAAAEDTVSVKTLPPVVVRTVPAAGDTQVDAAKVTEIRVTFSKDMMDKSWSWSQLSDTNFPKVNGDPHYDRDRRTCVLPVKLEPGKAYAFWLNSEKFGNFKDADGMAAVPYLLVFETKAK
jgi:RNA polymerase sigma-70 factor (ECF subfamily)